MGNDLVTAAQATDCSMLVSTAEAAAVLSRAFDHGATFTRSEIALAEQIAAIVPVAVPADEDYIRRSIGSLAGALPSQATSAEGGKLKLKTYQAMLSGCDERALAYACRRCLDELDWMPTVHQLKERMDGWVSPEQAAISRARMIVRAGRRAPEGDEAAPADPAELAALRERLEGAGSPLLRACPTPVPFDHAGPLRDDQIRIPNKGDYERLFGIDPDAERAKAEQAEAAEQERDRDLLLAVYEQQVDVTRRAA